MVGPTVHRCGGRGWSRSGSSPSSWRWWGAASGCWSTTSLGRGTAVAFAGLGAVGVFTTVLGAVVAWRVPDNPVGVLLTWAGGMVVFFSAHGRLLHLRRPRPRWVASRQPGRAVLNESPWWLFVAVALLLLYFPDGRLPSARWRFVPPALVGLCAAQQAYGAVDSQPYLAPLQEMPHAWGPPSLAVEIAGNVAFAATACPAPCERRLVGHPVPQVVGAAARPAQVARSGRSGGGHLPVRLPRRDRDHGIDRARGDGRRHCRAGPPAGVGRDRDAAPRPVRRRPRRRRHRELCGRRGGPARDVCPPRAGPRPRGGSRIGSGRSRSDRGLRAPACRPCARACNAWSTVVCSRRAGQLWRRSRTCNGACTPRARSRRSWSPCSVRRCATHICESACWCPAQPGSSTPTGCRWSTMGWCQ